MTYSPDMETLVDAINRLHGTAYRLGERFSAGEQGAFALVDAMGTSAVLKWVEQQDRGAHYRHIRRFTDVLRQRGYPLPRMLHFGMAGDDSYLVLEKLPGETVATLSPEQVKLLVRLNDMQADAAPEPGPGWQQNIVQSVLHGFDSYCVISSLENHSRRTADLLERLQGLVAEWDGLPFRSSDTVHFDFHHNNILFNEGELTGVVDWDGVSAGDRAFDLVTLLFYLYDNQSVSDVLWRELQSRSTREAVGSYLAHMIVRQLDWLIRFYDEEMVEVFTGISEKHQAELQRRFG